MVTLLFINSVIKTANNLLDFVFLWGGLFLILQYPFQFFAKSMDKYAKEKQKNPNENRGWELISQSFILFFASVFVGLFWVAPELGRFFFPQNALAKIPGVLSTGYRWAYIFAILTFLLYVFGHEYGEGRWRSSILGHGVVIFSGLVLDGWMGVLFISLPVLLAYYVVLYCLAMVTLPTANPDDQKERWKRFTVFAAYVWGLQFPMVVVDGHAWEKPETRINGDFTWDYPVPGLIWAQAHQVVGITNGIAFKRVEGPGLIFTGKLERAEQIVDLRRQVRVNDVNVVTRDGISLVVVVLSVFRIDNEKWGEELYRQLRTSNPLLRGANIPTQKVGLFEYSAKRVQAALSITSSKAGEQDSTIYWDQWAVNVVEDQARKIVAQKTLDELWRLPEGKDKSDTNALKEIANEIKKQVVPILRASGILLYASSVVNFKFPNDEMLEQQIHTWGSEWEGKKSNIIEEAKAEAKRSQQEARAYAATLMMEAIEEGLHTTQLLSPNLKPHMTAMLFSALQEYIDKSPDEATPEEEQHYVRETQEPFMPYTGKKS